MQIWLINSQNLALRENMHTQKVGYLEIKQLPQSNSRVQYNPTLIVLGPGFKPRYRKKKKEKEEGEKEERGRVDGGREGDTRRQRKREYEHPDEA